jgi:hypothetical protein
LVDLAGLTVQEREETNRPLLDAGIEIARENFGAAAHLIEIAISEGTTSLSAASFDELLRLLRLVHSRGYGEKLIAWFQDSGLSERQAPIYAAFVAYVRGSEFLFDVNPEVRRPAESIYKWLGGDTKVAEARTARPNAGPKRAPRRVASRRRV